MGVQSGQVLGRALGGLQRFRQRYFPERQFVIRERDHVRAFTLSSRLQTGLAVAGCAALVWGVVATVGYGYTAYKVAVKSAEIERTRTAYHELVEEVSDQNGKVQTVMRDLEHYRSYLATMLEQNETLQLDVRAFSEQLETSEGGRRRVAVAERALLSQLRDMQRELSGVSERNDFLQTDVSTMRSRLVASEEERQRFAAARAAVDRRIGKLEQELGTAQTKVSELERGIDQRQASIEQLQRSREQALAERDMAATRVATAERKLQEADTAHQLALVRLSQRAQTSIALIEGIVSSVGLDVRKVLPTAPEAVARQARGGPFVPWRGPAPLDRQATRDPAVLLDSDIARLEAIRTVLRALPLATPMRDFMVSGHYGFRRDPFNGRSALHEGIDLVAPVGTPVRATANGRVAYSGWHSAYGRLIEIDHGNGIKTRFAHLSRALVATGDVIQTGQVIGELGQTGRASGPHLHYETIVEGRPVNPVNFLKVNSYVLKDQ